MNTESTLPVGNLVVKSEDDIRSWVENNRQALMKLSSRLKASLDLVKGTPTRWIDIGCGMGLFSCAVADRAESVVGLDLDPTGVQIASSLCQKKNVDFKVQDLFAEGYPEQSFDGVSFLEVIEHVDEPLRFLREFHRILKPGGQLILSTPNANSYSEVLRRLFALSPSRTLRRLRRLDKESSFDYRTNAGHLYAWTYETLQALLARAGFEVEDIRSGGYYPIEVKLFGRLMKLLGSAEMVWLKPIIGTLCHCIIMRARRID